MPEANSYIGLASLIGKKATITKVWSPASKKGTSCNIVTADFQARAYCKKTVTEGQTCKVTDTMSDGNAVFIDPAEPDLCSTVDLVFDHDNRITELENWIPVLQGLVHDMELLKDRCPF